ncbi:MAG: sialate O-acetylesterase, partial [Planctomycetaceae bacterium]
MSVHTVFDVCALRIACVLVCVLNSTLLPADVRLPSLFGNHMVVQRDRPIRIWGSAAAGQNVTVRLHTHTASASANAQGRWSVELKPLPAGGPHRLSVTGKTSLTFEDVLVGEVWLCSGQSNMAFSVSNADDADLEIQAASYPSIRLISVPRVGTQEPQRDFAGEWQLCNSSSVASFSAVGYFFGRQLHQTLDVPIGLIDNAWGGSAAEAWVQHDRLQADPRYAPLLDRWKKTETTYDHAAAVAEHQQRLNRWQQAAKLAKANGKPAPRRPRPPRNPLSGQHRPANLYNGVLQPVIGYGMRGVIWYQGESNANRAYQYRHLFP